ncbi:MAG: hypothetical protein ABEJ28_10525 [Salinigranum sp.]
MADESSFDENQLEEFPLLKPGAGVGTGDEVIVKAEYTGESIVHRYRHAAWKLLGIDGERVDFDDREARGLLVTVKTNAVNPQKEYNHLFVDEVVGEFDSAVVDDMIDRVEQKTDRARPKREPKTDPDLMSDIDTSKL